MQNLDSLMLTAACLLVLIGSHAPAFRLYGSFALSHPKQVARAARFFIPSLTLLGGFTTLIVLSKPSTMGAHSEAEHLLRWGAAYGPFLQRGEWWRALTAPFLHMEYAPLFLNSLGLLVLGLFVARISSGFTVIAIFLICGICGVLADLWNDPQKISFGAAAGVAGLAGFATSAGFRLHPHRVCHGTLGVALAHLASAAWLGLNNRGPSSFALLVAYSVAVYIALVFHATSALRTRLQASLETMALTALSISIVFAYNRLPRQMDLSKALASVRLSSLETTRELAALQSDWNRDRLTSRQFLDALETKVLMPTDEQITTLDDYTAQFPNNRHWFDAEIERLRALKTSLETVHGILTAKEQLLHANRVYRTDPIESAALLNVFWSATLPALTIHKRTLLQASSERVALPLEAINKTVESDLQNLIASAVELEVLQARAWLHQSYIKIANASSRLPAQSQRTGMTKPIVHDLAKRARLYQLRLSHLADRLDSRNPSLDAMLLHLQSIVDSLQDLHK